MFGRWHSVSQASGAWSRGCSSTEFKHQSIKFVQKRRTLFHRPPLPPKKAEHEQKMVHWINQSSSWCVWIRCSEELEKHPVKEEGFQDAHISSEKPIPKLLKIGHQKLKIVSADTANEHHKLVIKKILTSFYCIFNLLYVWSFWIYLMIYNWNRFLYISWNSWAWQERNDFVINYWEIKYVKCWVVKWWSICIYLQFVSHGH